jgi:hypothetical protein
VPPAVRSSTGGSAVVGRERPRLGIANLAPEASGGVAHAPRVIVRDVRRNAQSESTPLKVPGAAT